MASIKLISCGFLGIRLVVRALGAMNMEAVVANF